MKLIACLVAFCAALLGQLEQVAVVTVPYSATPVYTCNSGDTIFKISVNGPISGGTFTCPTAARVSFVFIQDATGHLVTLPSGLIPFTAISATPNATSVVNFISDGTTAIATEEGVVGPAGVMGPQGPKGDRGPAGAQG